MKFIMFVLAISFLWAPAVMAQQPQSDDTPTQSQSDDQPIRLQDTIRASLEQPKVLSIVPWQPPSEKQALPSPIIKRIEQSFTPLSRAEFTRQLQHFEKKRQP